MDLSVPESKTHHGSHVLFFQWYSKIQLCLQNSSLQKLLCFESNIVSAFPFLYKAFKLQVWLWHLPCMWPIKVRLSDSLLITAERESLGQTQLDHLSTSNLHCLILNHTELCLRVEYHTVFLEHPSLLLHWTLFKSPRNSVCFYCCCSLRLFLNLLSFHSFNI